MYICWSQTPNLSLPLFPPLVTISLFSMSMSLILFSSDFWKTSWSYWNWWVRGGDCPYLICILINVSIFLLVCDDMSCIASLPILLRYLPQWWCKQSGRAHRQSRALRMVTCSRGLATLAILLLTHSPQSPTNKQSPAPICLLPGNSLMKLPDLNPN